MSDIFTPEFWANEDDELRRAFIPVALTVLMAGARGGAAALPPGVEVLINWDAFNGAAVDWLRAYEIGWLRGINATAQRQVLRIVEEWILRGDPLPVLSERLTPFFGTERAERIAVTEVTRIYAEGNIAAWRSTGIVGGKIWQTSRDDAVCPVCGPLHNVTVGLDSAWSADLEGNVIEDIGGFGLLAPPAHVRCRCWLKPVVSDDAFLRRLDQAIGRR